MKKIGEEREETAWKYSNHSALDATPRRQYVPEQVPFTQIEDRWGTASNRSLCIQLHPCVFSPWQNFQVMKLLLSRIFPLSQAPASHFFFPSYILLLLLQGAAFSRAPVAAAAGVGNLSLYRKFKSSEVLQ